MSAESPLDDWVGRPTAAEALPRIDAATAARGWLRRGRVALRLLNGTNLAKAAARLRRGELRLLVASARNLVAQRAALTSLPAPGGVERFDPPPPPPPGVPLVTVVIPCFNDRAYVGEAVASALSQTFPDVGVVVVEGGSTDGETPEAVRALAGPRVRTLHRTDGRHLPGDNRNFGVAHSESRYVCCLDADDVLDPTYVEKLLFLLEYRGYDVCSSSLQQFGAGTERWAPAERPTLDDFALGNHALVCALFRRALWREAGGFRDTGLGREHVAEDWDLWFRLAGAGARFRNLRGEALLRYRVRGRGLSVGSHFEAPSYAEQGAAIRSRNAALLTAASRDLSRRQAARQLRPSRPDVAMREVARRAAGDAAGPRLLLAVPFFSVGGAERLLSQVVGGLVAAGWRVTVVSTEFEGPNGGDSLPWFAEHTPECYALPRFLDPADWRDFLDYLLGSRRPDALLIAGSRFAYDLLPRLAAEHPAMARLDLLFNTVGHVAKHMEHRAHLTGALCENAATLGWLRGTAAWPEDTHRLVPSGVDTRRYAPGPRPADLARSLGIGPDDVVVGWSGRLSEEKSPEVFLSLAARCRDLAGVHFVMTGGGRLADRIAEAAAALPAGTRLYRMGLVDDVAPFFRLYDVFVLTSELDGRPLAVMEAQASGCAVLASRVGGVPEIVGEGETGLLANPADPDDFERALRAMLADRARLAAMRVAAARFARGRFSLEAMAAGYRRALEDAVAARRRA